MRYKILIFSALLILGSGLTVLHAQTVRDIDGNVYQTLIIGTQTWMAENLKTTKYRNGDIIKTTTITTSDIRYENAPLYQWAAGGKESNVSTYGRLYTWYAVTDSRGVCPVGWHVPTDAEWATLITFMGGDVVAYSKLKEAGELHWIRYDTGSNETGFTALPGGSRNSSGPFLDIGSKGNWWSSTEHNTFVAWYLSMSYDINCVHRYVYLKRNGLSVRCIKN